MVALSHTKNYGTDNSTGIKYYTFITPNIQNIYIYHIIYKSSNRNKVHDKFGIMYFENQITMQIRSRD